MGTADARFHQEPGVLLHTADMSVALRNHWVSVGSPYRLATPPRQLMQTLATKYNYTVYYYPDYAHQIATPAEDHTAYSETGWPIPAAFGVGWAVDIMPHADPKMPTPGQIGAKMLGDKLAGRPELAPLKYINWTDAANNCWHDKWQPNHVRTTSSDRGHTHFSCRSDMETSEAMANYDPVAELLDIKVGEPMRAYKASDNATIYLGNGMFCRTNFTYAQFQYMVDLGLIEKPPAGQPTAGGGPYDSMIWVLIPGQVENYAGVLVPWGSSGGGNVNFPPYTVTFTGTGTSTPA